MDLIERLRTRFDRAERTVLEIDLSRGVLTAPPDSPVQALQQMYAPSMRALRDALRRGAQDERVAGLVVHIGNAPVGLTVAQELGELIAEFDLHKPTIAFAESFGEMSASLAAYTLATQAREVWVQPSGELSISGVHLGITLVRGLLEKAGVEPQFGQRHEYKTAAEQIAGTHISEANLEMMQRIADSVVEQCKNTIAARRSLSHELVQEAITLAPLTPEDALARGLIDQIGYRDEVYSHLFGAWEATRDNLQFAHRYSGRSFMRTLSHRNDPVVAVVQLRGAIVTGRGRGAGPGGSQAGSDVVTEQLRATMREDRVQAVVLRVDSPGGSAVASDSIWRAIHQVRESGRPVVASMGAVAASGGYYTSMAANEIVALPSTLTGSIGVLSGKLVIQGLYDKLGLKHAGISTGGRSAMMASDQPFSDEDWQVLNTWLDRIYHTFTSKAAADRGMAVEDLEPLARGRVWTGADAVERHLVDHIGGMGLAVERACELAGLDREAINLRAVPSLGLLDRLLPAESSESGGGMSTVLSPSPSIPDLSSPELLLRRGLDLLGYDPAVITGPLALPWQIDLR